MTKITASIIIGCCAAISISVASAAPVPARTCPVGKAPIVIGGISSLSGPWPFPESQRGAAVAFDAANAQCGVHGRPIVYAGLDDAAEADRSRKLAVELIRQRGAVALVGGTSAWSCRVNADLFAAAPVAVIPGAGTGPECFASKNIAPANEGMFSVVALALKFAASRLAPNRLCLVGNAHPMVPGNFDKPVSRVERMTGRQITIVNQALHAGSDAAVVLQQLRKAGCDVTFVGTLAEFNASIAQALARSGDQRLKLVLAPEAYTREFAARLSPVLDGRIFAVSGFDFLDSPRPGMRRLRGRFARAGIEPSPFAVGGYLAGEVIVSVLRGMDGQITRQSVLAALDEMPGYDTEGLTAGPYVFHSRPDRPRIAGVRVVVLKDHTWAHATEDWITP